MNDRSEMLVDARTDARWQYDAGLGGSYYKEEEIQKYHFRLCIALQWNLVHFICDFSFYNNKTELIL